MKKGKVFTKGQIGLIAMVIILAGAVWLNTKYSKQQSNTKYMGETTLVGADEQGENKDAAMVGAGVQEEDYFAKAKSERETAYKEAEETIAEALNSTNEQAQKAAAEQSGIISKRKTDEIAIENLLIAKGFEKALAIIGDESVTVVIQSDGLLANETVQIQDAVMSLCDVSLGNIKIVTVNS